MNTPGSTAPDEELRSFQERVAARVLVSDASEAAATWQFLRRFGTAIDGLPKADQGIVEAIAQVDDSEAGRAEASAMLRMACAAYQSGDLDVVGAARALDAAFLATTDALDAQVAKLLRRVSSTGAQALATAQADAGFVPRQRRRRDWEGLARDVPKLVEGMIPDICRRLAASTESGGTQAPALKRVFAVSGRARSSADMEATRDALKQASEQGLGFSGLGRSGSSGLGTGS